MANNCDYECRIVGRTRESVQQIADALKYQDLRDGYYLCRIFSVYQDDDIVEEDGLFHATVYGDCAWSVKSCMIEKEYFEWRGVVFGEPEFRVYRNRYGELCYTNLPMTMPMLCRKLDCGVEIWYAECGCEFQEHYIVDHRGDLAVSECRKWVQGFDVDENGDFKDYNPEKDEGGFDEYGTFSDPGRIYGEEK